MSFEAAIAAVWKGSAGVKLIVGLGNPGIEYQFTPHNAGFLAVDRIAEDCGVMLDQSAGQGAYRQGEACRSRMFCWPSRRRS